MEEKIYYVIQNKDGEFFALDSYSGGYPVFINDFEFCENIILKRTQISF